MMFLKFLVISIALLGVLVKARLKSPLLDEDRGLIRNKAAECVFGKQVLELGAQWIPDLGVPIGVLYCMKCECIPFQRKRRIVARVQCRNIKNECPEPTCDDPVLLPERCCKTCPGDNKNESDFIQDIVPQTVIEEEERRIFHFAALLTGRSSLDLRNETSPKDINKNNVIATGRFTFHKRNLHYSFYISETATSRPRSLQFLDSQGNILEEFILSQPGGLVNSVYQNATRKVCGIWRRLPRDYRRLLKNEKMYVVLMGGTKDSEFTLSGRLTKYVALASEQFSSLLEPAPGTDSTKMAGAGGMAIVSTSSLSPSIHVAIIFNGLFENTENSDVAINVVLGLEETKKILLEENIKVRKPASDLNFIELSSPVNLSDLRSLSRGRVLLTVSSVSNPSTLRLAGSVITKITCEIFQTTLVGDKDVSGNPVGLAWMYLNNQGALIYNIQVDNIKPIKYQTLTLTDIAGKKKTEVLNPRFDGGWANGTEEKLVHKILEALYNNRLDVRLTGANGSLHGHLNGKLVADARDAPSPILLKRENSTLPSTAVGLAWISVDNDCHIHYDISVSGLGHDRKMELYLEMYPIIDPGAPVFIKPLEEFEGNQVEGSPLEALTKEEMDMLEGGVTFIKLKDFHSNVILLSAMVTKVNLPMSCRAPFRDNNVPVIYDMPSRLPTEDCLFEGKFYKKDSSWVSKNPCQMCYCQDGQYQCYSMTCPDLKCPKNNMTVPGECCPICGDPEVLKSNRKCVFNGMTYSSGSKFHPFLIPTGFEECTVCTCDPIDLKIKCRRIEGNSAKCGKGSTTTPESVGDDSVDLNKWPQIRKEEVSNADLILKEGGCKNIHNKDKPYKNGSTFHPHIGSLGEYKCVTCKCKNGTQTCAREPCEWKNCKILFDRKRRSKKNKSHFSFSDLCCSLKVCQKIRHQKKMEENSSTLKQ